MIARLRDRACLSSVITVVMHTVDPMRPLHRQDPWDVSRLQWPRRHSAALSGAFTSSGVNRQAKKSAIRAGVSASMHNSVISVASSTRIVATPLLQ
jgi:hypothetical protein